MEKAVIYAEIPEFDQATQYVVQLPPVEMADAIYYGVEVKELEIVEEPEMTDTLHDLFFTHERR